MKRLIEGFLDQLSPQFVFFGLPVLAISLILLAVEFTIK